ncbi:hypothetical protein GCM10020367_14310 [Streptomyces sannanensis]|uniref:Transposase IS701-like DDE domain-containing protein n=1 Tax=Streptomyces sannanensis TaxID=285536 RepID=A0ABP6S7E6_9ACTN
MGQIAGRFERVEPRRRVRDLVLGLLSDLPRENCWSIAEWAGEASPDGMQHLPGRARWDADRVRECVLEHLGDENAVLVVDETGDVKMGTHTVGVQRQYTGTAGRIENAQVAVYLVYAGRRGRAAVDRELYVPRSWTPPGPLPGRRTRRPNRLRHQTGAGCPHDRSVPGRRAPRELGRRRRGLRRQPEAAGRAGSARGRLRACRRV